MVAPVNERQPVAGSYTSGVAMAVVGVMASRPPVTSARPSLSVVTLGYHRGSAIDCAFLRIALVR